MSLSLDLNYISLVSNYVENWLDKGGYSYNFSCPICGDSKTKKKRRGYIYKRPETDNFIYRCYNCNSSLSLKGLLQAVDGELARRYSLEKFLEENNVKPKVEDEAKIAKIASTLFKPIGKPKIEDTVNWQEPDIASLPSSHAAKAYLDKRCIPLNYQKILRYTDKFHQSALRLAPGITKKYPNDERILIPFYGQDRKLMALQGRALDPRSDMRYLTIKRDDHRAIFNMDRVDFKKTFYVLEGPFDSMFIDNAVAAANTDLDFFASHKANAVLVFDNQPRNESVVKVMNNAIKNNWRVVIWPKIMKSKDVNDAIEKEGFSISDINEIVRENTYDGMKVKIMFERWKRY